jgi:hypothetical protein
MEGVMRAQAEAAEARSHLGAEQQRIAVAGGGVLDRRAWRETTERLERATRAVQAGLEAIASLGGVPKDLSLGLVDFPHRRGDDVVNLCWKYGEQEIRFWHGLDEGYAGRKPL